MYKHVRVSFQKFENILNPKNFQKFKKIIISEIIMSHKKSIIRRFSTKTFLRQNENYKGRISGVKFQGSNVKNPNKSVKIFEQPSIYLKKISF